MIRSFILYTFNGMAICIFAMIVSVIIGILLLAYWMHLHHDTVHETPGYVFLRDLSVVGKWICIGIVIVLILFVIGYYSPYLLKCNV